MTAGIVVDERVTSRRTASIGLGILLAIVATLAPAAPVISTLAGNLIPTGPATRMGAGASGIAANTAGDVYFADPSNHTIRRVDHATGISTVVAGTGTSGYAGDGGPATSARLNSPKGVAMDAAGNLYIADTSNHRIRKIDAASGTISTIAGTGTGGYGGDNAAANLARINTPQGVAVDGANNVYIADTSNNRVRKINAVTGNISTVAGNGTGGYLADNVAATGTRINAPRGVVVDGAGNLYIADTSNNRIRKVDTGGTITTVAGTGTASFSGDNGAATSATIRAPQALTLDGAGNLYIADTTNHRVRKVSGGVITTLAGTGSAGYGGDGGVATSGQLSSPAGIAVDGSGNLYIGDTGNARVRRIAGGIITTFAGTGSATYGGDGGRAVDAQFTNPQGIVVDGAGNLYLSDSGTHRIRKIDANGVVTTIAGTGVAGYGGDGGPATSAQLNTPLGISRDAAGNLYVADGNNNRIRRIDANGIITTFAGNGTGSFGGDGGPATGAQLFGPFSVHGVGNAVYIADTGNNRIRKVDGNGKITTVAGTGTAGFAGDGGQAIAAQFNTPIHVAADSAGNLYICDYSNGAVRRIDIGTGLITTVAGNGANGYGGDNGPATSAQLNSPRSAGVDAAGNLYVTDTTNSRVRKVDAATGIITTIAGDGNAAFSGDGGPPSLAQVSTPQNITVLPDGTVYLADTGNRRFRVLFAAPPGATTAPASNITATGAAVNGTVNDNGTLTTVSFDYGTTAAYGSHVAATIGATVAVGSGNTAVSATLAGLACNTAYHYRVVASNGGGTNNGDDASFTTGPCAQTITFANPGAQAFGTSPTLSATSDSGLPVTFSSSTSGVCTITSGGMLTFVSAGVCTINADQAGNAGYAAATTVTQSFATDAVPPGAPVIGTATGSGTQATVSFTAPAFTGGTSITGYTVTSNPGGIVGSGASSPIVVTGLAIGTSYTFTVTATNAVGTGPASAASNGVTLAPPSFGGPTATGTGLASAAVSGGTWAFAPAGSGPNQSGFFIPVTGNPKSPPDLPPGYTFPHGLFDFLLVNGSMGGTATVTITYPQPLPAGAVYWKYGPTATDSSRHWYPFPAVISGNTVSLTITDGGLGDDDLVANGMIVDQGGPAIAVAIAVAAAPVPALGPAALLVLALGVLGTGAVGVRRYPMRGGR